MDVKIRNMADGVDIRSGHSKTSIEQEYRGGVSKKIDPEYDAEHDKDDKFESIDDEEKEIKQSTR